LLKSFIGFAPKMIMRRALGFFKKLPFFSFLPLPFISSYFHSQKIEENLHKRLVGGGRMEIDRGW
jgi:hypothetical protein